MRSKGIASIDASFLQSDAPFIPKKFGERPYHGQSEDHANIKLDLAKRKVQIEMKRLQEQAVK